MSNEMHRDIGRLEAEVAALKVDVAEIASDVKAMRAMVSEVKGGWRVLAAAGAIGAGLMAALIKIVPYLPWGR